ncbi:MAG: hypothetical protein Q7S25_01140 [Candidatus Limnocylindria bacterium]|nr:hypothetical protein [Candidatus Limnocylindria bacterium]
MLDDEPENVIANVPALEVVPEASVTRPPGDEGGRNSLISTVTPTCGWWFQYTSPTTLTGIAVAVPLGTTDRSCVGVADARVGVLVGTTAAPGDGDRAGTGRARPIARTRAATDARPTATLSATRTREVITREL